MGKIINFNKQDEENELMKKSLLVLTGTIDGLIHDYTELQKDITDPKALSNNSLFIAHMVNMNDIMVMSENKAYKEQIKTICARFPAKISTQIATRLEQYYTSGQLLIYVYLVYFLSLVYITDFCSMDDADFMFIMPNLKAGYRSCKVPNADDIMVLDFNQLYLSPKALTDVDNLFNAVLKTPFMVKKNQEIKDFWVSFMQKMTYKIIEWQNKQALQEEKWRQLPLSTIYAMIAQNNFRLLYRFQVDENNCINIYYNAKCQAFLEELIENGVSNLYTLDETVISYPIQMDEETIMYNYLPFSEHVEEDILADYRRLDCIPPIKPYFTIPFGVSIVAFEKQDSNYYSIDKIRKIDKNTDYVNEVAEVSMEIYYNALRFMRHALNECPELATILGPNLVNFLNELNMADINITDSPKILAFKKSEEE